MSTAYTATPTPKIDLHPIDPAKVIVPPFPTKAARLAWVRQQLAADPAWAAYALLAVYARQTANEQQAEQTEEDNGVGFTGTDAEFLTSLAKQVEKYGRLSTKQIALMQKRMAKYASQTTDAMTAAGTAWVIDKKVAKGKPVAADEDDNDDGEVEEEAIVAHLHAAEAMPATPTLFAPATPAAATVPTPAVPDWAVWKAVMNAREIEDLKAAVTPHVTAAEKFTQDVWETVSAKGYWSEKQARVLAIGCAKAAANVGK